MDTTVADPLVGKLLDGRYRVESRIARGGMATVYVALDIRLDRTVALKVMHRSLAEDPAFVRRFIGEAKSVASLSHPNVVQVFDQGADGDVVFLSMEYVRGRTLRDVLRERGRIAPREALELLIPVLAALGAAHQKGMIHRDVKPENVLLTDDGRVKVVDFGLARAVEASNQTRTGVMIGTIGYMSPEQVTTGSADARSDVYAAGIMLFELVTGRQPYDGDAPMAIAYKHVHDTVPPPSQVLPGSPPALDALVGRATARDPGDRPGDATALLVAAVEAHRALASESVPPGGPASPYVSGVVPGPGMNTGTGMATGTGTTSGAGPRPTQPPHHAAPTTAHGGFPMTGAHLSGEGGGATLIQPRVEVSPEDTRTGSRHGSRAHGGARPPWLLIALGVVMLAAVGFTGWWFSQASYVKVPDLVGKNLQVARTEAEGRGLVVRIADGVNDREVAPDLVLRTEPVPGNEVEEGSTITLTPSLGPKMIAVPNLEGVSEADARTKLAEAGLAVDDVQRVGNDTVQRGLVLRTDPQVGNKVKEGGKVDLVLSAGLLTPDVMALPRDQAEQFLREKGFNPQTQEQADDAQPCTVIAQEPGPKDEIDAGAVVNLTVSQCQREWHWPWETPNDPNNPHDDGGQTVLAAIPNELFKNVRDAERELRAAGFKVKVRKLQGQGSGRVRGQSPLTGQAPPGTEITIWH